MHDLPPTVRTKPRSSTILRQFRTDPIAFLRSAANWHTPEFRLGETKLVLLTEPEDIETVLVKRQQSFEKGPGLLRLRPLLGDGLLTAPRSKHARNRRLLQQSFSQIALQNYACSMPQVVQKGTEEWRDGQVLDVRSEMAQVTLAVVARTLFASLSVLDHHQVGNAVEQSLTSLFTPLKRGTGRQKTSLPLEPMASIAAAVAEAHAPNAESTDFLTLIGHSKLTEREQREEIVTFLLAGHESVATSLSWTWHALAQNPAARQAFEAEIDRWDGIDIEGLPYTAAVIAESLRLYPPAWMFSRAAIEEVDIGGTRYAPGTVFIAAPCVTHVDPRFWRRPEQFNPARWLPVEHNRPRYAYFPFGGGARRCIGEQFARTELTVALATIAKKWRLDPAPDGPPPTAEPIVTLRPTGLMMTLTRRTAR